MRSFARLSSRRFAPRPRTTVGTVTAVCLTAGLLLVPSGSSSADPTDDSEGLARIIDADLLSGGLADVGVAASGNLSETGPNRAPIDVGLLGDLGTVTLPGLSIPLIGDGTNGGLLDLGGAAGAGLLNSYSSSPSGTESVATAGAVGDDGAINVDATSDPDTVGDARLDLTALLGQLGVDGLTDDVVDQLSVEIGALASRAAKSGDDDADRTYGLAGARLTVRSPAVEALAGDLQGSITELQSTLNAAVGAGGTLGNALAGVNLRLPLAGLATVTAGPATASLDLDLAAVTQELLSTPLVDDSGFISIDLAAGTITVDLAKVVKNDATATTLNGLAPNTELLSTEIIGRITDSIGAALGDLGEAVGPALTSAINSAQLTVSLPGAVDPLIGPTTGLDITLIGSLGDFAGTSGTAPNIDIDAGGLGGSLLNPVLGALRPALSGVVVNVIRPVVTTLLATVTSGIEPGVDAITSTALTALRPLFDQVLPNIVTLTVNEQTDDDPSELENEAGSSTVRALAIDLLPNLGNGPLAEVNLASSTVRVGGAVLAPVLTASPESLRVGDTVTATSSGWDPDAPITVTYADSDGTVIGTSDVTTDADGEFVDSFVIPVGTPTGDLTITGTDAEVRTASDTVQVLQTPTLDAGPPIVLPGDDVTTDGAGWLPDTEVVLTYTDANGDVLGTPVTVQTDDAGELTDTFTVPAGTPPGTLTITGVGSDGATATDSVQIGTAPTLVAAPEEISAGDTVTVMSGGWSPATDVTITYTDAEGTPIDSRDITTDDEGNLTDTFTLPAGTPLGDLVVAGTDPDGRTATDTVQVVADPAISSSPGVVMPGDTVASKLTGYPPDTEVEVTYTDADGEVVATQTVTTDADGTASDTLVVPAGTPAGELTISGDDGDGNLAEDSVIVAVPEPLDPSLTAGPPTVLAGETVDVVGGGFPPNTGITVTYTDADDQVVATQTVTTDDDGAFTDSLVVPDGTAPGELAIVGDDGDGNTASDSVVVEAPVFDPTLMAAPDPVQAGEKVTAVGSGYPPNTSVEVTYTDVDGEVVATQTVTSDDDGAFTDTLALPTSTPTGTLTISGDAGEGNLAEDSVQVAAPPFSPILDAEQTEVAYGDSIDVVSSGWPSNTDVEISYTDRAGDIVTTTTVTTDGAGNLTDSVTVPAGTALGELTVRATGVDDLTAADTVDVLADPVLVAGPGVVAPGETVTSNLTGFPPNTEVEIVYTDGNGDQVGGPVTVTTDAEGSVGDTLEVPAGTADGVLTVTGDDGAGNSASDSVIVATPDPEPADPRLMVGPDSVMPGETVTVVGGGYPPNTEVTVTYTDDDGDVIATQAVTTDGDGAFTDTLVVPAGTPGGDLTVDASDGQDASASGSTTVVLAAFDPELVAGPGVVVPGETVTSNLTGYPPNTPITITYTDRDGNIVSTTVAQTDEDGAISNQTFVVPAGTPLGALTVTGADGDGNSASDVVNIAGPDAGDPTIIAGPPTVTPGDTVDVDGSGFPPNTDVTVTPTDSDGDVVGELVVRTDGDGSFSGSFVVPVGTAIGPLTIVADDGNGSASTATIQVVAVGSDTAQVSPGATGLPNTGTPVGAGAVLLALALLVTGAAVVIAGRSHDRSGRTRRTT